MSHEGLGYNFRLAKLLEKVLCGGWEHLIVLSDPTATSWHYMNTCLWSELEHNQWPGNRCSENINAKFFAYERFCFGKEGWYILCGTVS